MTTSGAVEASTYGFTVYNYPVSGAFAADRVAIVGNTSSAAAEIGAEIDGLLLPPKPRIYTTDPVMLDGVDFSRTIYRSHIVTVPIVIYEDTAAAALTEWRRIIGAFEARHQRAAIEVTDPAATGQDSRWLTELIYRDCSKLELVHDQQRWHVGRMQFETLGSPFWTPEPLAANEVSEQVSITSSNTTFQIDLTNPGDVGAWPEIDVNGLNTNATVTLTLAASNETVTITDVESGNTGVDFDRRVRPATDDGRVAPGSRYFQIPPGDSRVDVVVTEAVAGNSWVSVSFLPRYTTA